MGLALRIPLWIATLVLLLLAGRAGAADHCSENSAQLTREPVEKILPGQELLSRLPRGAHLPLRGQPPPTPERANGRYPRSPK